MISAIRVALMAPTSPALRTDTQTVTGNGLYGSFVRSYVSATTNENETIYNYVS